MKIFLKLVSIVVFTSSLFAQTTTVTGTFQDPTGQIFANGSYRILFVPTPGNPGPYTQSGVAFNQGPFTGVLDASGSINLAGTIADNSTIQPAGSKWQFYICPNATAQCTQINITITGASQNISSVVNAVIPTLVVSPNPNMSRAYKNAEITPVVDGSSFFDVSLNCPKVYSGGTWTCYSTSAINLSSPPPIGNITPNTGDFNILNGSRNAITFTGSDLGAQINSAIASCTGATNCPVYIQQGTYNITSTINFANGVVLECAGPKTTMLNYTGSGWLAMMSGVFDVQVRNCGITLQSSALGAILVANNGTVGSGRITIADNYFTGGSATSYWVKNTSTAALNNVLFYFQNNVGDSLSGYGVWIDHSVDNTLSRNTIYGTPNGTTAHPLVLDSGADGTYIETYAGGASGKVGLTVSNKHNLTTTTGSISPGSSISIPVADSTVCAVGLHPTIIDVAGTFEGLLISSIPDGTHVVVSTVANSHAAGSGLQCGQGPLWIFADDVIMDCAHDDGWLFDSSLNYGEGGVLGSGFNFTNSWAAGAGLNCYTTGIANPNGNGIHISGGHAINISGTKIRSNTANGILIDNTFLATNANISITAGNQISGNNMSNTAGNDGIKVTTNLFGINVGGNRITNDLDNGFQNYAFETTGTGGGSIDFSNNICLNNTLGCYKFATPVGYYTAINNLSDSGGPGVSPIQRTTGPLAFDDPHVGGGMSTWIIPQPGIAGSFSQGICANIHWDGSNWVTPTAPTGGSNGGTCVLGNSSGALGLYAVTSTGITGQSISNTTFQADKWMTLDPSGFAAFKGDIYAENAASNTVVLHAQPSFTNWTWNWPTTPGTANCPLLSAGGAAAMTWASGFSGTKTAGTCVLTIVCGIITNVTGC